MIENGYYERDKFKMYEPRKGVTILEMVMAIGIIAAIFAALLPLFVNINNSWASRQGNLETLQVERIVTSHMRDRVAFAKSIIAVSDPDETDGFLEYEDVDGITYRYELSGGDLVFGPVGNMATLAESVTELEFECYAIDDLDDKITDVDQIRFIKAKMKIDKPSGGSETVAVSVYLRTGVSVTTGIVGWWKLDETSGFTASDSSGYDNHGTLGNMSGNEWTGGVLAGALEFDGSDDCVTLPFILNPDDGDFTATAWVFLENEHPDDLGNAVLDQRDNGSESGRIWLARDNDTDKLLSRFGGEWLYTSDTLDLNSWYHVAVVYDKGASATKEGIVKMYIDGEVKASADRDQDTCTGSFRIGRGRADGREWDGTIDDVRIYNRALSAEEIAALANILKYKESTEAKVAVDTTSITISTPGGTDEDDLLIAAVATDGSTSVSLLAPGGEGWTEINTGNYLGRVSLGVWWKLADASESPDHQFTWIGPEQAYGWMMRFTGHDPANPINTYTSGGSSSSTPTSLSVTTTVDNALILRLGAFDDSDITESDPGLAGHTAITMDSSSGGEAAMYWTDRGSTKIQRANLDGSSVEDLLTGLSGTIGGITIDVAAGKMYWVTWDEIRRANLDGSSVEDLLTGLSGRIGGIAIDVAAGKMYWVAWNEISRADLDGSNTEQLVTGLNKAIGIAIDVAAGKMYWTDAGSRKLQRANLDGSSVEDLLTGLSGKIEGIAIDVAAGKVYWVSSWNDISRADFDGSNTEQLVTGLDKAIGIMMDISGGKMYWTDRGSTKIQRANLNGSSIETLVSGLSTPTGIALSEAVGGGEPVSGGAAWLSQSSSGSSGTSEFSLTASQESRMITIGIAQDPASGGSLMP